MRGKALKTLTWRRPQYSQPCPGIRLRATRVPTGLGEATAGAGRQPLWGSRATLWGRREQLRYFGENDVYRDLNDEKELAGEKQQVPGRWRGTWHEAGLGGWP